MSNTRGEFFRFLVVGVGSTCLNFLVYVIAHSAGLPLVAASFAGYLCGLTNSYYFGKIWVFNAGGRSSRIAIFRFAAVYATGGIGMSAIIEMFDRTNWLDYRISWFFGAAFAFTNNFLGSKWLVFKGGNAHNGN